MQIPGVRRVAIDRRRSESAARSSGVPVGSRSTATPRRATELDPDGGTRWTNRGDVPRMRGRAAEAIAAYREASRLAPDRWYEHRLWIDRLGSTR
jgi:hypothetical protein